MPVDSRSPQCIDGETLAAWISGGLRPSQAAAVEEHLSNCERCQSMVATFVRIEPTPAAALPVWRRWQLRWLVPIATAATVAGIWVAIPREARDERVRSQPMVQDAPDSVSPPAPPSSTAPAAAEARRLDDRTAPTEAPIESRELNRERRVPGANAPEPVPPQAPSALSETVTLNRRTLAIDATSIVIVSSLPLHQWRITGGRQVDYSSTGGKQWDRLTIPGLDRVTAGHSPAPPVAWLVGPAGAIYVTSDGTRFEKVSFIEPIDLVAVVATDDRQATVTASDGRVFRTTDRAKSWSRVP